MRKILRKQTQEIRDVPCLNHPVNHTVYLADLAHNFIYDNVFSFPLNIGYIATYLSKHYPNLDIRLFKFPGDLLKAIKIKKPQIVGFSNFIWNTRLNDGIMKHLKSIDPGIITVGGGPYFPLRQNERYEYLQTRPDLDFYVFMNGEIGFCKIVERFLAQRNISKMKELPIDNCAFVSHGLVTGEIQKLKSLDEIPSPYLTGRLDSFFESNLIPMLQTNRGCYQQCRYCAWTNGIEGVHKFSFERVQKEIEYIAARAKKSGVLFISDANFGRFERDLEFAKKIKACREGCGYPYSVIVATAKNCPETVIRLTEILPLRVHLAFQSLNPRVLKNIGRSNMSLTDYRKITAHLNSKQINSLSELILGLPGETRESFEKALIKLLESQPTQIQFYNLSLFHGAELGTKESRERFGFETRFRLIDGAYGKYDGISAIESEEIVIAHSHLTIEDTLYFRPIGWFIQFMWSKRFYKELLYYFRNHGTGVLDFIKAILEIKNEAPAMFKDIINDFCRDAREELFSSRDELEAYYTEHFDRIAKGDFAKLNYKYITRIMLEAKGPFEAFLVTLSMRLLGETCDNEAVRELLRFCSASIVVFGNNPEENILEFDYDILAWKRDGCAKFLETYKRKVIYKFCLEERQKESLRLALAQRGKLLPQIAMRKFLEYIDVNDLFYRVVDNV